MPGIHSEADEAFEDEEFDEFGFKVDVEIKLVKLFRFDEFLMKIRQMSAVYVFISSPNLFDFLNSRNSIWSWRSFRRWRIWQIRFQSWCWNQTCEIVQISRFFFIKFRQMTAVCLFQALIYLFYCLNSKNPFWSWRSFWRWRIWRIRFQSWCWNQTCYIVPIF